jgi:RNA-directed DNA polymerase
MHEREKSDPAIGARKPANEAAPAVEERVEQRAGAKGNANGQSTHRTQSRGSVSQALERVRTKARGRKTEKFTALLHHIDDELLRESFYAIQRKAAPGVDGVTWKDYAADLDLNLTDLRDRIHRGAYRAMPSRRVYIPKADGRQRPLAVAALEDKIVQRAAATVLEAIYEEDFLGFSYGFRPGRGAHDALDALAVAIGTRKVSYILDADIQSFLDPVSYCPLVHEVTSKSSLWRAKTLMRSPFCRPRVTWTASISPRLTRCNTVCRETASALIASRMGR